MSKTNLKFKVGDTVHFTEEWCKDPKQLFTVVGVDESTGQYDLKQIPNGFYEIGSDEQLESGSKFLGEVHKIYHAEGSRTVN